MADTGDDVPDDIPEIPSNPSHVNNATTTQAFSNLKVCSYCGKEFKKLSRLESHMRTHTGERPFECEYPGCDKRFSRKDHMIKHYHTHTGTRNYKCPVPGCPSAFTTCTQLKRHQNVHENGKKYACTLCDRTFPKKSQLRDHRLIVHSVAEFRCMKPDCMKMFPSQSKLDRHKKTHDNDKAICCYPGCYIMLKSKRELNAHINQVHRDISEVKRERIRRWNDNANKKAIRNAGNFTVLEDDFADDYWDLFNAFDDVDDDVLNDHDDDSLNNHDIRGLADSNYMSTYGDAFSDANRYDSGHMFGSSDASSFPVTNYPTLRDDPGELEEGSPSMLFCQEVSTDAHFARNNNYESTNSARASISPDRGMNLAESVVTTSNRAAQRKRPRAELLEGRQSLVYKEGRMRSDPLISFASRKASGELAFGIKDEDSRESPRRSTRLAYVAKEKENGNDNGLGDADDDHESACDDYDDFDDEDEEDISDNDDSVGDPDYAEDDANNSVGNGGDHDDDNDDDDDDDDDDGDDGDNDYNDVDAQISSSESHSRGHRNARRRHTSVSNSSSTNSTENIEKRARLLCPHEGCGRSFLHARNLSAHIKAAHSSEGEGRFICTFPGCNRRFAWKHVLQKHEMNIHKLGKKERPPTRTYVTYSCENKGPILANG